jgi:hypothetical protein
VNGHKFAICLSVTSPPSVLSSSSEPALPPPSASAWRAGQPAAVNVPVGANSILSSSSFAQIFSDLQAHSLNTTADSAASTAGREALASASAAVKVDAQVPIAIPAGKDGLTSLVKEFSPEPVKRAKPTGSGEPNSLLPGVLGADSKSIDSRLPDCLLAGLGYAQSKQGQSGVPQGSANAEIRGTPIVPIRSSTSAKAPKQAEMTANPIQSNASLNILSDQAIMNLAAAPSNNVASDGHLLSRDLGNRPIPAGSAADKTEAGSIIPRAQLAAPVGNLAFALRLKSGGGNPTSDGADNSGDQDPGPQIGGPVRVMLPAAESRLLSAIIGGSNGVLSYASSEVSNSRATAGWAQGSSASSFATQLKALTDGLPGQGRVAPISEISVPSGTSSESRGSVSPGSSNTGANLGLANIALPKAVFGGMTSTPPVTATGAFRSGGLLDSGQFSGAQVLTANGSAQPSATAGTETIAATRSLPENETAPASEPVRNIRVQLSGEGNQHVDMRLVERGGTLSVSVRSTDETLTRSLQENLPELNTRLTAQHFQAETWMPGRGVSTDSGGNGGSGSGAGSDSGTGSNGSGASKHGSSSPDGRSDSQSHSRQSQDGRQDRRPAWVRQLAAFDGVPQMTPGQGMKN